MNKAINTTREQVFKSEHLSYYTNNDTEILDESRTIPPSGLLLNIADNANFVEIDISKAYTGELKKLNMIQMFTQFDKRIDYAKSEIEHFELYRVYSTTTSIIQNKRYKLLVGLVF